MISFNLNEHKSDNFTNEIINKLSKINSKPINKTSVSFVFNENIYLKKINNNKINCDFKIKCSSANGDTIYKKFSIKHELLPNHIIYSVTLNKINSDKKFEKSYETLGFNENNFLEFSLPFYDSLENSINIENYTLNVISRKFIYNDKNINKLDKRLNFIDNYYISDSIIKSALIILRNMNTDSVDMLAVYNREIKKIEISKNKLIEYNFPRYLNLESFDPINFLKNIQILSDEINNTKNKINISFSNLDYIYTQTGLKFLKSNNTNEAKTYFFKAIQFNPEYIPAQLEIAKLNIKAGNIYAATDSLINIYSIHINNYDENNKSEFNSVAVLLKASLINKGNDLLAKEDYTNAISIFEKGFNFCSLISTLECDEHMTSGLIKAKTGLYYSYIKIARKALANDRLEMSGEYLGMAKNYKLNNTLIDNNDDVIILEELINAHTQKGLRFLNFKSFDKAIEQFDIAKKLSSDLTTSSSETKINQGLMRAKQGIYYEYIIKASTTIKKGDIIEGEKLINEALDYQKQNSDFIITTIGTDTLYANIYNKKYKYLISEGKQLLGYGHYEASLEKLSKAKEIEKIWIFKKANSLDSLIMIAAKPIILENLADAKIKTWGNDLTEAEKYFKIAYSMQYKYGLNEDKFLQDEINNLNDKIFDRHCKNANELFNKYYSQALRSISVNDFILTGDYLDMAINVAVDYPQCNIPIYEASEKKSEFLPAITYQNLISDANDAYFLGNYQKAVITYKTASQYYIDYRVKNIGLLHIPFSDFLIFHDKPEFLLYCINYFIDNKMYDEALSALTILKNKKFDVKETKKLQKKLGLFMGIRDAQNSENQKLRVILLKYTGNDKFFSTFSTAYRKGWRKNNSFINIF